MAETAQDKIPNRWIRVVGAILMQLALGCIYAWSIFNKPLAHYLELAPKSPEVLAIFAVSLAGFGLFVSVGGMLQDRRGPRQIGILAGVIYAVGYVLSSMFYDNLGLMYVSYALLGAGVGIGYSCPLSCCVKWFPDKRGLIAGIAVAGFGAGTFIFAQVGTWLVGSSTGATPYANLGDAYLYLGLIFLAMVIAGSMLLCDPPTNFCPAGWTPPQQGAGSTAKKQFKTREMVHSKVYWMIWAMYILSATCGLMMIGNVSNVAQNMEDIYAAANPTTFHPLTEDVMVTTAANVALMTGILALFNGAGRVIWGFISDKVGRTRAMKMMFMTQTIILFVAAAFIMSKPTNEMTQFVGVTVLVSLEGFCFGGNFALFPPITAEYFGTKHYGSNYGVVFTAYAVGGVTGAMMPAYIKGGFEWVFIGTAVMSLVAFVIALMTKPPVVDEQPQEKPSAA